MWLGSVLEEEEKTKRAGVCGIIGKVSQLTALSTMLRTEAFSASSWPVIIYNLFDKHKNLFIEI